MYLELFMLSVTSWLLYDPGQESHKSPGNSGVDGMLRRGSPAARTATSQHSSQSLLSVLLWVLHTL